MNQPRVVSIDDRASANLRYIRQTMERAGSFTAVPGWGGIFMGVSALGASFLAHRSPNRQFWFDIWIAEAAIGFAIGAWAMVQKATTARVFLKGPGRAFALNLCPAMAAGVVLTMVFYQQGIFSLLPGLWLTLYGVAVVGAGTNSVRVVPIMGVCFMALGVLALAIGPKSSELFMALGFGILHIVFGGVIARRYGG